MVKYIISAADIHIKNLRRQEEYQELLNKFIEQCKEFVNEHNTDEVRIVLAGDILHNKLDISCEAYALCSWFLKQLDSIAKTIVILGNHDANLQNTTRLDPLSLIFSLNKFKQTYFLDKELNYESGVIEDDNILWCLYSAFDNFTKPDLSEINREGKTLVGLFHGTVVNASTDAGYIADKGVSASIFKDLDFVIMGHIHKFQCINTDGVPLVYCGSLIQQDHGENIDGHGYVIWDVENVTYEKHDINNNDYGFYTFQINDINDISLNDEELINV